VCRDLDLTRQLHARNLPKRRVRLLRGGGVHAGAYTTALRAALQSRGLDLADLVPTTLADQLLNGWHLPAFSVVSLSRYVGSRSVGAPPRSTSCAPRPGVSHALAPGLSGASWTCELARQFALTSGAVSRRARGTTIPAGGLAGQSGASGSLPGC